MGPRRKITQAISEIRGSTRDSDERVGTSGASSENRAESGSTSSPRKDKAKLLRQSSTDVTEAYREVTRFIIMR